MSPLVRFAFAFMLPVLLVLGGTAGYAWIEKWTMWESLYMTVITVSTVGYGEVHPLSPTGQRFTILLLTFSVIAVGYSMTTLIGFVFEGQILHAMRGRRMTRSVSKLKDHYIICGGGVVGKEVAQELKHAGMHFVIVDKDPEHSELGRDETVLFVEGHAEDDEVLVEAGIHRAKGLIAVLREDALNVFVVLSARQANPNLKIVARGGGGAEHWQTDDGWRRPGDVTLPVGGETDCVGDSAAVNRGFSRRRRGHGGVGNAAGGVPRGRGVAAGGQAVEGDGYRAADRSDCRGHPGAGRKAQDPPGRIGGVVECYDSPGRRADRSGNRRAAEPVEDHGGFIDDVSAKRNRGWLWKRVPDLLNRQKGAYILIYPKFGASV